MTQMYSLTDWALVMDLKEKLDAGEALTEKDVDYLRRLLDWLELAELEDKGFPEEWTA